MDIMELGAVGELVGGVAVIATLFFLATQVRHGNRLAKAQVHQEVARMSSELARSLDHDTFELFHRVASDPAGMTEFDLRVIGARFHAGINYYETLFYANERGDVDPDLWDGRRFLMEAFIAPVQQQLWEPLKPAYGKRFRDFVDRELLSNARTLAWDRLAAAAKE